MAGKTRVTDGSVEIEVDGARVGYLESLGWTVVDSTAGGDEHDEQLYAELQSALAEHDVHGLDDLRDALAELKQFREADAARIAAETGDTGDTPPADGDEAPAQPATETPAVPGPPVETPADASASETDKPRRGRSTGK